MPLGLTPNEFGMDLTTHGFQGGGRTHELQSQGLLPLPLGYLEIFGTPGSVELPTSL